MVASKVKRNARTPVAVHLCDQYYVYILTTFQAYLIIINFRAAMNMQQEMHFQVLFQKLFVH